MSSDKVTVAIDTEYKLAFLMTKDVHNKEWKDALELGVLSIISEVDPVRASKLRIQKLEQVLAEERQTLANYEMVKQVKKLEVKKEVKDDMSEYRDNLYNTHKEDLQRQAKNPKWFQWDTLQKMFGFKNRMETENYIFGKLKADGAMN